jgi:diguanylate cyclase (GGDEF)-like protein
MDDRGDEWVAEYAAALPEQATAIAAAVARARSTRWDSPARIAVRHLTHQLVSSALTFGFHELGQALRRIEGLVAAMRPGEPDSEALLDIALERLAALARSAVHSPIPRALALPHGGHERGGRQPLVMLVDDDHTMTQMLTRQLQALGFATCSFAGADAAVVGARELQPQVVLLDVMFPDNPDGGFELATRLLADVQPAPAIIFLTGRDDLDARRRAVSAGALTYLTKPVNLHALSAILEHRFSSNRLSRPRVILVEDDIPTARLYARFFERAHVEALIVTDPLQLFSAIYDFQPDVLFMDLELPGIGGVEVCQLLRQHQTLFDIPVIALTGRTEPTVLRQAMLAGMDGILQKDNDLSALIPLIHDRAARHRRMRHSMSRDVLTGLLNRGALLERLDLELLRLQRLDQPLSLAIVDIDHFKQVNDEWGHLAGDAALLRVAREIQGRLRATDFAGRLGGDEFLMVLPNTAAAAAIPVIEDVLARVRLPVMSRDGRDLQLTASVGLVDTRMVGRGELRSISLLMAEADVRLYDAKRLGRDRVVAQTS